jgi:hypothetical protein
MVLIVNALKDNVDDLQHCALVCRAWVRLSRVGLLRNPIIGNPRQYDGLYALLEDDPSLQTAVRTIYAYKDASSIAVLTELVPRLSNLRHLWLTELLWPPLDVKVHSLPPLAPLLTDLSLSGCTFASCTAFASLLASVPALRSLEFDFLNCDFSEEDAVAGEALFANPVILAELAMEEFRKVITETAILALGRLLRPRKLTWDPCRSIDVLFLVAICEYSGTFLVDFHVVLQQAGKP